jgi:AraC-like DNA-binding protein
VPFWRLYYNPDPGLAVDIDSRRVPLPAGALAAIPPMSPCTSWTDDRARQLYIHFTASEPFDRVAPGVYFAPLTPDARESVDALMTDAERTGAAACLDTVRVLSLCLHVLRHIPPDRLQPQPHSARVREAIRRMRSALARPLGNPALARAVHMNTNAFINLFRQETGQPPQRWYLQMHLRRAGLLLAHSDQSIEEIADRTGFSDRNHFTKVFRRYHQIPPAAYRRNVRQSG